MQVLDDAPMEVVLLRDPSAVLNDHDPVASDVALRRVYLRLLNDYRYGRGLLVAQRSHDLLVFLVLRGRSDEFLVPVC